MGLQDVAAAIERMRRVLARQPQLGLSEDSTAVARWEGGLRMTTAHPGGTCVASDMPAVVGGLGDGVTPGWLFRAGLAACSATSIAMAAAAEGVELAKLELATGSRSDGRGVLGMRDAGGRHVAAHYDDLRVHVRIAAPGVASERLHALVHEGLRRSPVFCTVGAHAKLDVRVDVEES